jgi:hypothetical protein
VREFAARGLIREPQDLCEEKDGGPAACVIEHEEHDDPLKRLGLASTRRRAQAFAATAKRQARALNANSALGYWPVIRIATHATTEPARPSAPQMNRTKRYGSIALSREAIEIFRRVDG